MTLISDHLGIAGFGICSGMGSCGTCRVDIHENGSNITRSCLACEEQVSDALANSYVIIPDNIY